VLILKESLERFGHKLWLTLNFSGAPNRLLLMFQSACIPYTGLYSRIKAEVVCSSTTYVSEIKGRENMALLRLVANRQTAKVSTIDLLRLSSAPASVIWK